VRRELQHDVHPLLISWGYEGDDPSFVSRHEKQGTRDPSACLTVPTAIAWPDEHEWAAVRDRCHELARPAHNELDLEPLTPDSAEFFGKMVTLRLPKDLQERLYAEQCANAAAPSFARCGRCGRPLAPLALESSWRRRRRTRTR
jgi:isopenicillin-N epimerase